MKRKSRPKAPKPRYTIRRVPETAASLRCALPRGGFWIRKKAIGAT